MRALITTAAIVLLSPAAHADALIWRGDRSTCLGSRPSLDDLSLPVSSYELGPMLDPARAGWAALDAGCGRTRVGIRVDRAPITTPDGVTTLSLPVRLRIAEDWTAYALPALTAGELGNVPLALSRRSRALSPWGQQTTIDVAALVPSSTSASDRAYGVGVGAGIIKGTLGIAAFNLHATTAFDLSRTVQTARVQGGGTVLLGVEIYPFKLANLVADLGQRVDRDGYHLWGTLGVRALVAPLHRVGALGVELAVAHDIVADTPASSGWLSLYLLR